MRFKAIQRPIIITFLGFTSLVIELLTAALYIANTFFARVAEIADFLTSPATKRPIFTTTITSVFNVLRTFFTFPIRVLNIPQLALGLYLHNSYYVRGESQPLYVKGILARLKRIGEKIANGLSYRKANTPESSDRYRILADVQQRVINSESPTVPVLRPAPQLDTNRLPETQAHDIANQLDSALSNVKETKNLGTLKIYLTGLFDTEEWWQIGSWNAAAKEQLRTDIQTSQFAPNLFYAYLNEEQRESLRTNENLDSKCSISSKLVSIPVISGTRRFDLLQLLNAMLTQAEQIPPNPVAFYAGTETEIDEVFIDSIKFNEQADEMIVDAIDDMINPKPPILATEHAVTAPAIQQPLQATTATYGTQLDVPKPPSPPLTPQLQQQTQATSGMQWIGINGYVPPRVVANETPPVPSEEEVKAKQLAEQEAAKRKEQNETARVARVAKFEPPT